MKRKRTWILLGSALIVSALALGAWWLFAKQPQSDSAVEANENCH